MSIPFRIRATDEDMENLRISLLQTNEFQQIEERGNRDYSVDYYPLKLWRPPLWPRAWEPSRRAM